MKKHTILERIMRALGILQQEAAGEIEGSMRRAGKNAKVYLLCCVLVLAAVLANSGRAFETTSEAPAAVYTFAPESGQTYAQAIPSGSRTLISLWILFDTYERVNEGEISVSFYRNGEELQKWTIPSSDLLEEEYREFRFGKKIRLSEEDNCYFTVTEVYTAPEGTEEAADGGTKNSTAAGELLPPENQVGIRMAGQRMDSFPEMEISEEGGGEDGENSDGTGEEDSVENSGPHTSICYRLTTEDTAMRGSTLPLFVVLVLILCAAGFFLIDLRRIAVPAMIGGTLVLLLVTGTVAADLMREIVTDVVVHPFQTEGGKVKLSSGDTLEETIDATKFVFTAFEFSITGEEDRSDSVHVRLTREVEEEAVEKNAEENADSGEDGSSGESGSGGGRTEETLFDRDIAQDSMLAGGPAGRRIRISADQTTAGKVFPKGRYHCYITNTDEEKKLRVAVYETIPAGLMNASGNSSGNVETGENDSGENNDEGEEEDAGQEESGNRNEDGSWNENGDEDGSWNENTDGDDSWNGYSDADGDGYNDWDSSSENGDGEEEQEEQDSGESTADSGAATGEVVVEHLNYSLVRRSSIGYRIAFGIFFLLGLYCVLILRVTGVRTVSAEKFFLASAMTLGTIYLILMLPWTSPDARSHFLAAYRFSNVVLGRGGETEWSAREEDLNYLPDAWTTETLEPYFLPDTEDYARAYLTNGRNLALEERERDGFVIYGEDGEPEYGSQSGESDGSWSEDTQEESGASAVPGFYPDEKMKFYSWINYLPQIAGLTAGRFLGLSARASIYLARILMLIVYILACDHAVRTAPVGKMIFAGISVLPMALLMSSSFCYDAMVLLSTFCFIAAVLRVCFNERTDAALKMRGSLEEGDPDPSEGAAVYENSGKKQLTAVLECALWAAVIGSVKGGGYLVLLPLSLILLYTGTNDSRRGRGASGAWSKILLIVGCGLLAVLVWNVLLPTDALFQFGTEGAGRMAFSFVLQHPVRYLEMMLTAYLSYMDSLFFQSGGIMLSRGSSTIPSVLILSLMGAIVLGALLERDRLRLTAYDRGIFILVILVTCLTTPAMLLSWTPIGSKVVEGLQGRYYLPILPLLFLIASKGGLKQLLRTDREKAADRIGRNCVRIFCVCSCLCVYWLLRLCLTW